MQQSHEHPAEEIKRLQRCISDLATLLALRAAWRNSQPAEIGHSLLDTLLSLLSLDLAYVRLNDAQGDKPLELVRVAPSQALMPPPQEVCAMLNQSFGSDPANWSPLVRLPIGEGDISIVPIPLGLQAEVGMVAAGSRRTDFPAQTERLLLRVASNQALMQLQEARLLSEQKQVATRLDQVVELRTWELAAANDELRMEIAERKIVEEKLRQDERELRRITDAIPEGIAVLDPQGAILYVNQWILEYSGLSREELLTPSFRSRFFHPEDVAHMQDEVPHQLLSGLPFENERRALGRDGKYRWFLIRYNPLHDEQGRILRWYATGTDIDDRKRAEQRMLDENMALREEIDRTSMYEEIEAATQCDFANQQSRPNGFHRVDFG